MFFVRQGLSKIDISLEKDAYQTDEKAVINCSFDNTQCQKDIKEVKVKLRRVMQCIALNDNKNYEESSIIKT